MTEQPLEIKRAARGVWRRRRLVGALAVAGLLAGVGYGLAAPDMPRAVSLILLPPSALTSSGLPARDMRTQILLATSDPVLGPAARAVTPPPTVSQLRAETSARALSQQVLQVQVSAHDSREAVELANAVAKEYVHYVNDVLPAGSNGGPVQVLQPAAGPAPASSWRIPGLAASGVGGGLLIGLLLAVVLTGRDRRLRSRDQIAMAIGAPVLASLEARPCTRVAQWQSLLEDFVPSPVVSWSLRRVLHRLAPAGAEATREIRVISFAGDSPALAAATQLAVAAATLGMSTALRPGDAECMVQLRAACVVHEVSGRRPGLTTFGSAVGGEDADSAHSEKPEIDPGLAQPDLTVSLVAVERDLPEVRRFGGANVLSVSCGFATADELARLALAAADAAQAIDGILAVNPDPGDGTVGAIVGEGTHRAEVLQVNRSAGSEHRAGQHG